MHNQAVGEDSVLKSELEAAVEARKELGEEMEPAVIDAFVARIEQRLADRGGEDERALKRKREHQKEMVLGSMAISIPLFAIAAVFTGLPGVVAVCLALAVIAIVSSR
jgi:cytochrome P450